MSFTELVNNTGELIQSTFVILESLNNKANILFVLGGIVFFFGWIWKMNQYDKEADRNGTMR